MKKFLSVLVGGVVLSATALIVDYRLESRSRFVARPDVRLRGSAPEYKYSGAEESCVNRWTLPAVKEYLKDLPAGASVADLGCGNGSLLAAFRDRGWKMTGVDISKSGIEIASKQYPDISFSVADATEDLSRLGYGQYDAVISTEVIEHIILPRKYAANAFRLLKPGGMLVMTTPYHGYLKNLAVGILGNWDDHFTALWDFGHIKFWSVNTLSRLLFESGFDRVEWRGTGRYPHFWKTLAIRAWKSPSAPREQKM